MADTRPGDGESLLQALRPHGVWINKHTRERTVVRDFAARTERVPDAAGGFKDDHQLVVHHTANVPPGFDRGYGDDLLSFVEHWEPQTGTTETAEPSTPECDGSSLCAATEHTHGCFSERPGRMADRPGEAGQGQDLGSDRSAFAGDIAALIREQLGHLGPFRAQVGLQAIDQLAKMLDDEQLIARGRLQELETNRMRAEKAEARLSDYEQALRRMVAIVDDYANDRTEALVALGKLGLEILALRAALSGSARPREAEADAGGRGFPASSGTSEISKDATEGANR